MAKPTQSRRSALQAIGLFLAGAAGLWRFLTPRAASGRRAARQTIAVAGEDVPADGALVLPQFGVAVVRDGSALLAVNLACTHLGCTVTATTSGFACPCHGSRFNKRGATIAGPASHSLRPLDVEEKNGIVRVSTAQATFSPGSSRGELEIGRT